MKKYRGSNGDLHSVSKIESQDDIQNIRRHGFYGECPEIGDYSHYLGGSDGGFIILKEGDPNLVEI